MQIAESAKTIPDIIREAAQSQLGILALMIIAIALLGYAFFRTAGERIRIAMFVLLFAGVVAFAVSISSVPRTADTTKGATATDTAASATPTNNTSSQTAKQLDPSVPTQGAVGPAKPGAQSSNLGTEKALIISDLKEAYLNTGWKLAFFEDWGRPQTRPTLHVNAGLLTGTAVDGRVVSLSVDPKLLPIPSHYNASLARASPFGQAEAVEIARFFSSYDQFHQALVDLTSKQSDFDTSFLNAVIFAREAVKRGRAALCSVGVAPPRMFPDGGFPEPVPPDCSTSPFAPPKGPFGD